MKTLIQNTLRQYTNTKQHRARVQEQKLRVDQIRRAREAEEERLRKMEVLVAPPFRT